MSKRTVGLFLAALLVLVISILTFSLGQVLATRFSPTVVPTRTPRPTWTPQMAGLTVASPTLELARVTDARGQTAGPPPGSLTTPQLIVAGEKQPLVVPPGSGQGGVVTVVVVIVTATPVPPPPGNPASPGAAGAAGAGTPIATAAPTAPAPPTRAAPTPTPSNTPPPPVLVHVTIDQAFVRQGPGMTYPLVTKLDKNTTITVVGRNRAGDWWKVCCVNGSDVWIAASVVTVEGPLWTVPEVTNIPPSPTPTLTPAPTPTITLTPTFAWEFNLRGQVQSFPHGENFFMVGALVQSSGGASLYGYKLRVRKLSTGQEWLSKGSDAFLTTEPTEWRAWPTPPVGVPRNVKWDSNMVQVSMDDGPWDVTLCDGGGTPLSAPVNIWTSGSSAPKWYYMVFVGK